MSIVDEFLKSQDDAWKVPKTIVSYPGILADLDSQNECYLVMTSRFGFYLIKRAAITGLKVRGDVRKPPQEVIVTELEESGEVKPETMQEFADRVKRGETQ